MLTAIVLAHNEERNIAACLDCLHWCEQIIVVDHNSTDQTVAVAKKNSRVEILEVKNSGENFAQLRNEALKKVTTPWVMYIDADERVTAPLAGAIKRELARGDEAASALILQRQNICYGYPLHFGGWENDRVERIFRMSDFDGYQGAIHESPIYRGEMKVLQEKLIHLTHRSCVENLYKTAAWTPLEAQLLAEHETKKVTAGVILRKGAMEFYRRFFKWRGRKDGLVGFVESLTQAINRCLVYIQVWELQQQPNASQRYAREEEKIVAQWKKVNSDGEENAPPRKKMQT